MAVVKFKTLGALDLRRPDGSEIDSLLVQPKRLALLAYLCAGRPLGFHRRDTLLALLWPESDPGHARTSLRSSLHGLRRSLGDSVVRSRGDEEVSVNFDEISCDAVEFEDLVCAGKLAEALELYRGAFLTGFFVAGANSFERWVDSERARLRGLAVKAAHTLSEHAESRNRFADAVRFARLALNLCDGDEKEVRRLIMALLASGDRPAALRAYDEFSNRVAEEFETQPSPETTALISAFKSDVGVDPARSTSPFQQSAARKTIFADGESRNQELAPHSARGSTRPLPFWRKPYALLGILAGILGVSALIATRAFSPHAVERETRRKITSVGTATMASLSPDGEFLAYVTQSADSQRVVVEDIAAGTQRVLESEKGAILSLEWSPDGTRLLMGSIGRAVVIPRLGDSSRTIGPDTHDQPLAYWLPDSVRLSVHSAPDRRVLVFDPRTQDTVPLPVTGKYTWLNEGSWSPTGHVFAAMLEWNNPLSWEIRAVGTDSANHSIVRDTVPIGSPRWSRDGHFLYYARGFNSLWRVAVDPKNGVPLGAAEEIADDLQMYSQRFGLVHFAISADGRSVLYSRGARYSNIWIVASASPTSPPHTIPLTTGTLLRWSPVPSPDGKWIAFAQEAKRGAELFKVPTVGGPAQQITDGASIHPESQIAWSPSGEEIAFTTLRGGYARVRVARVDNGGRLRQFDSTSASTVTGHLTWAPGSSIAYQISSNTNIHLLDPASGLERALINEPQSIAMHSPQYSPDGKHIAAFWFHGPGTVGIYSFDAINSTFRKMGPGLYPRGWARDGRHIYYQWPQAPIIYQIESDKPKQTPVVVLNPPFREAQCVPIGASLPNGFVCAAFDFASDIWRIDNFERRR